MAWPIVMIFVVLDLAGVYFNMRMLLSCFKSDTKRGFLQTYRPLVIYQFIYQVSVLALNTIEAWDDLLHVQHDGFCNYFKISSISINIFLVSNFAGMLFIATFYPVVYKNQYLSPVLLMLVPLCLGIIGSAVFWWCSCFLHLFELQVVAIIFCAVFLILLLVNWKKYTQVTQLDQTDANLKTRSLLRYNLILLKENKKACFLGTWIFIGCGVVVSPVQARGILSGSSLEEFDMFLMVMMNVIVGICLPIALTQMFYFIGDEDHVMKTIDRYLLNNSPLKPEKVSGIIVRVNDEDCEDHVMKTTRVT